VKEGTMKGLLVLTAGLLIAGLLAAPSALAGSAVVVNGGGTGSWTPAGTPPASQFGLGVRILGGGAAAGHFECLMSGRSAFPGFQLMAVQGKVTAGTATDTTASFSGAGTLLYNFEGGDGRTQSADVTFSVNVTEGGPGAGTLQLTVFGVPFVPGGVAAFPPEWVSSGQIAIH
jgi:hypothetical protein